MLAEMRLRDATDKPTAHAEESKGADDEVGPAGMPAALGAEANVSAGGQAEQDGLSPI